MQKKEAQHVKVFKVEHLNEASRNLLEIYGSNEERCLVVVLCSQLQLAGVVAQWDQSPPGDAAESHVLHPLQPATAVPHLPFLLPRGLLQLQPPALLERWLPAWYELNTSHSVLHDHCSKWSDIQCVNRSTLLPLLLLILSLCLNYFDFSRTQLPVWGPSPPAQQSQILQQRQLWLHPQACLHVWRSAHKKDWSHDFSRISQLFCFALSGMKSCLFSGTDFKSEH